jgi:hypothetical protein
MTPKFLTTAEAAHFLRLSPRTLEDMRLNGTGPRYNKLGPGKRARVVYQEADLLVWVNRYGYGSTSEYPGKSS